MTVRFEVEQSIATITLNDPDRRNAMGLAMFDALDDAVARTRDAASIAVVLLTGAGDGFCAGFDLAAAAQEPPLIATYVERLSAVLRNIRRLPQVVVAAVHGAALAGGCALVSACDFVFVAEDAQLGYPVHQLGVSPAVTIPTLRLALGDGATRALLMSGRIVTGHDAHRMGLASHCIAGGCSVVEPARAFAELLARKPVGALRVTKAWVNELEGSMADDGFDAASHASAILAGDEDSITRLREFWTQRRR